MFIKKFLFINLMTVLCLSSFGAKAQNSLPDFTIMAENLLPTVVNITIEIDKTTLEQENNELMEDELSTPKFTPAGSGFIISEDGYIVTNKHVIEDATNIKASTHTNKTYDATVVGIDDKTDLALLKITPTEALKPVVFGNSDTSKVGEWILAIGNPFGLGGTVTKGIISAKSRDIDSGNYDDFIQTDASINRGNSGGPMFNMNEEVIGINSAIFSTGGGSMGIGFAIPINQAQWVIDQLKQYGEVKRGWIGVKIQENTPEIASSLSLPDNSGVVVSGFSENAPAQKAGLSVGDVILTYNGQVIEGAKAFSRLVAETKIGEAVSVDVWSNNKKIPMKIIVEEMPKQKVEETDAIPTQETPEETKIPDLGLGVMKVTDELKDKYSLSANDGVVITTVSENFDASTKGLLVGDVILKIDNKELFSENDLNKYVAEAKRENNRPVLLMVKSKDIVNFVILKLKNND